MRSPLLSDTPAISPQIHLSICTQTRLIMRRRSVDNIILQNSKTNDLVNASVSSLVFSLSSACHVMPQRCSPLLTEECLLPHEIFIVSQLSLAETCVPAVPTLWSCEVIMSMEAAASSYSIGPSLSNPDH